MAEIVRLNFFGDEVSREIDRCLEDNLDLAGFSTLNEIQELLNRNQATKKVGQTISEKSGRKIGGTKVGLNPSAPNTPPKRVTATLQKSYNWSRVGLKGRLGSPLKYAKFLEFGTTKMEPRPHLLLAFTLNMSTIIRALSRPCPGGL